MCFTVVEDGPAEHTHEEEGEEDDVQNVQSCLRPHRREKTGVRFTLTFILYDLHRKHIEL